MDTKTIKLEYSIPIKIKEEGVPRTVNTNELTMGRLKVKHLKSLPAGFMDGEGKAINPIEMIPLIASITDISVESAEEIDISDLENIVEVLSDFLPNSPETGKTQS